MSVIAGEWRGRRLHSPAGRDTRPTVDKVREAIFDVLSALLMETPPQRAATRDSALADQPAGVFSGLAVLDLFAGAGGLGSAVVLYLAAAGVGCIRVCDRR